MFERRLIGLVILMGLPALVVAVRLIDIQVARTDFYEGLADRMLTRPITYLRAPRGSIRDRDGRPLVEDIPAYDISVHYSILTGESDKYLLGMANALKQRGELPRDMQPASYVPELKTQIAEMWQGLSKITGHPISDFIEAGDRVRQRVEAIARDVERRTGVEQRVREEDELHPILESVDDDTALRVRFELEKHRWMRLPILRVEPGSRRGLRVESEPFVHLLGRIGEASPQRIESDTTADELRHLRAGDMVGVSGVEYLGELTLRGTRGRVIESFDRSEVERAEPIRGDDVRLTIDADLQAAAYSILKEAVQHSENPAGGSVVVLDAQTREILALVSYPGYSEDEFDQDYDDLRRDTRRNPLLFRAVRGEYPPGSTCKAITLYGGLESGVITPETAFTCNGPFLASQPNAFRCWIYNQYRGSHGPQTAVEAIQHSCNIYFFNVAQRLGAPRLCDWFMAFGLGRHPGSGLIEERRGIVPTSEYLRAVQHREHEPADAWNYAIGQGEVNATPLQAANVAATIATGRWAPVRLLLDQPPDSVDEVAFDERPLHVLRDGMWRVVNQAGGTAGDARLKSVDSVLCGKTGSAQTVPAVLTSEYTFRDPRERIFKATAVSESDARSILTERVDPETLELIGRHAAERFPPWQDGDHLPSHAWFMGFSQARDTPHGARPAGRCLAISVLVEFGGGGGRVAAPVARDVIEAALKPKAGRG